MIVIIIKASILPPQRTASEDDTNFGLNYRYQSKTESNKG